MIRTTTFGKVKYATTKLNGTTKHQMMATKANSTALQKEIQKYHKQCRQMTIAQKQYISNGRQ